MLLLPYSSQVSLQQRWHFLFKPIFKNIPLPLGVALIFAMEPVFAAITGYFWANERLIL